MENKTYGRKEIREGKHLPKMNEDHMMKCIFFITTTIIIAIIVVISIRKTEVKVEEVTQTSTEAPTPIPTPIPTEAPEANRNEEIMENVKKFAAYDDRIFTEEPEFNWSVNAEDFKPLDCDLDTNLQEFTYYLCENYNIDWTLVMALMKHESSFKSDIISSTDDYGLMQINTCNHRWLSEALGITDFLDPYQNIRAGVFVLRKLFELYEEPNLVLMAYNRGQNGAKRLWDKGIYSIPYSDTILKYQKEFNEERMEESNDNN